MKFKAILAMVAAVGICVSAVGCGSSSSSEKDVEAKLDSMTDEELESAVEEGAAKIDEEENVSEDDESSEVEETVEEIVYEPTNEILNAELSSGLVQIGNDIFRNGGYYTVEKFVEEFGDKYDMQGFIVGGAEEEWDFADLDMEKEIGDMKEYRIRCTSKNDSNLIVWASAYAYDACLLKDCPIATFEVSYSNESGADISDDIVWYAGGFTKTITEMSREDCYNKLEQSGIVSAYDTNEYENTYREQANSSSNETLIIVRGTEENLYGQVPAYIYSLSDPGYIDNSLRFRLSKYHFWQDVNVALDYDAMRETLKSYDENGVIYIEE